MFVKKKKTTSIPLCNDRKLRKRAAMFAEPVPKDEAHLFAEAIKRGAMWQRPWPVSVDRRSSLAIAVAIKRHECWPCLS